jgi:exonuclease SbcC
LEEGANCPVCGQVVVEVPDHEDTEVDDLERARQEAVTALTAAQSAHREAERERTRIADKLDDVRARLATVSERLEGRPDLDAIAAELGRADRLEADLRNARAAEREARRLRAEGQDRRDALGAKEVELRRRFEEQRDALAVLSPPAATREDLAADWRELADWADGRRADLEEEVTLAEKAAAEADAARKEIVGRIEAFCHKEGLVLDGQPPKQIVRRELDRLEDEQKRLESDMAKRDELDAERIRVAAEGDVAGALANHLKADRFERWILDEAMARLVEGATVTLRELSGGAYSLTVDDRSGFAVVDHANADTVRPARTLSGGETFLASLALALALADQIADLAAGGAVRLESILLDEGFGSLDLDTLDTVAVALEELGAQGRMVGVVTHVGALAERLPVRFEVRKGPSTSSVERVEV